MTFSPPHFRVFKKKLINHGNDDKIFIYFINLFKIHQKINTSTKI